MDAAVDRTILPGGNYDRVFGEPTAVLPENTVTRAAMAVFMLRAIYGSDYQPPAATGIFADLPVARQGVDGSLGGAVLS